LDNGESALMMTVRRDYETEKVLPIVKLLVERGGNLDFIRTAGSLNLLHSAASTGKADVVELLLAHNTAYLNIQDERNMMTPLHRAVYNRHPDIVYQLLVKGARIDTKDKNDDSPLEDAESRGQTVSKKLMETPLVQLRRHAQLLEMVR
jgi:ankyrin repeat protein